VRLVILAVLLLTLNALVSGSALAGGRAACRAVYGPPVWGVCYAEQVVMAAGPLEVAVGTEIRTWPEAQVVAYTVLGLYLPNWWATVEVGRGLDSWRWAVGAGVRW
jgi:hypothetical protein